MKYIYSLLIVLVAFSCTDNLEMPEIDPSVVTINATPNEKIKFSFAQQSDLISFYSGESGHSYSRKDSIYAKGNLRIVFTSKGEWDGRDLFMSLWYSKDFAGIDFVQKINTAVNTYTKTIRDSLSVDSLGLTPVQVNTRVDSMVNSFRLKNNYKKTKDLFQEATWTQVPNVLFGKDQHAQGGDWITTTVDLTSLSSSDAKRVTFAFRNYNANTTMGDYYIKDYKIEVVSDAFAGGKNFRSSGDGMENVTLGNESRFWQVWTTGWKIVGGTGWYSSTPMNNYALMFPLDLSQTDFPVSGDKGITISSFVDKKSNFEYSYSKPGSYTATIVFTNVDKNGRKKSTVKTYIINISE